MKTIKLNETKGMLKRIAKAMIEKDGEYLCKIEGEKVRIIPN